MFLMFEAIMSFCIASWLRDFSGSDFERHNSQTWKKSITKPD